METFYFILKTAFSLIFNGNCFCFLFSFEKIICSENQCKSKMFFKKEIRCREIALTLLFLELRVHILRWCRYGAEAHESGMYHFIFLSMGDPTTRSTGKIFAQSESKIKTIYWSDHRWSLLTWPRDIFISGVASRYLALFCNHHQSSPCARQIHF